MNRIALVLALAILLLAGWMYRVQRATADRVAILEAVQRQDGQALGAVAEQVNTLDGQMGRFVEWMRQRTVP